MPNAALILGPVVFQDFEIPESLNFGGAQRLVIHRLPGGMKVIDALGRDDMEITFSGIFSGPDATRRARALDELRALGDVLPLSWDAFFYSVVIKDFRADYHGGNWIPFRVNCAVLRDEVAAIIEAPISLAASVLGDVAIAAGSALASSVALVAARDALAQPDATTRETAGNVSASVALYHAHVAIIAAFAHDEAALASEDLDITTALPALTESAGRLAELAVARAYIGRAAVNLASAGT